MVLAVARIVNSLGIRAGDALTDAEGRANTIQRERMALVDRINAYLSQGDVVRFAGDIDQVIDVLRGWQPQLSELDEAYYEAVDLAKAIDDGSVYGKTSSGRMRAGWWPFGGGDDGEAGRLAAEEQAQRDIDEEERERRRSFAEEKLAEIEQSGQDTLDWYRAEAAKQTDELTLRLDEIDAEMADLEKGSPEYDDLRRERRRCNDKLKDIAETLATDLSNAQLAIERQKQTYRSDL